MGTESTLVRDADKTSAAAHATQGAVEDEYCLALSDCACAVKTCMWTSVK